MATKSLNFNIETIDRLRELFPDYANGNNSLLHWKHSWKVG